MESENKAPVLLWFVIQKMLCLSDFEQVRNRVMSDEEVLKWWNKKIGTTGSMAFGSDVNGGVLRWQFINGGTGEAVSGSPVSSDVLHIERVRKSEKMMGEMAVARMIVELRRMLHLHPIRPSKRQKIEQPQLF